MSWFGLMAYWRYRRSAKGRHGVHSPFVYRLIEEALRPGPGYFRDAETYAAEDGSVFRPDDLQRRLICHFRFREILFPAALGPAQIFQRRGAPDDACGRLIDWRELSPEQWASELDAPSSPLAGDVILVYGPHAAPEREAAWHALCGHPRVRLSIDLFRAGLLFFSGDFKERQHFVLKFH